MNPYREPDRPPVLFYSCSACECDLPITEDVMWAGVPYGGRCLACFEWLRYMVTGKPPSSSSAEHRFAPSFTP